MSDVTIDLRTGTTNVHRNDTEDWKISLIDTGADTMTGGRLRQALQYLGENDQEFCLTYGDGVSDLDISDAIAFHRSHGRKATVTAVRPASRYGQLALVGDTVSAFAEKPVDEGGWINGGFFILDRSIGQYLGNSDECVWEREPLERLAAEGELRSYFHDGFWQPMDTLRDRQMLEGMWERQEAAWKTWA
jgi:glucose-1-phosphate cytidylyltransferase